MIRYIQNEAHYTEVVKRIRQVQHYLWIGTADIKDLYVKEGSASVPLLSVLKELIRQGVEVRLIHAKEPGRNFADDFDKYPLLWRQLERRLCPRVHFKILIFDCETAYIGSANLTGAGLGMKGATTRNFEAGILTDDPALVDAAADQFDAVWYGIPCGKCRRKSFCGDRINKSQDSKDR